MKFKIIRDIRDYQILFLSLFLILGIATVDCTHNSHLSINTMVVVTIVAS
ncbi:hypothetical protein FJSC11DRAFT_0557 [Fischerella thermalis JSC-11]|jgi:hypothetical protein|uniref:Uncharacterized protein n=1 Tax=Fischerella thermalis JSC-11 TaxID=741277 RepID=G6FNX7_9CYAN|nr:hypothetical protein FJSC11DRAFT_0557 [Fischerella thermalis JSC-11]